MTKRILILGDKGKTLLIYGLLKRLSNEGFKVGYFKPLGKPKEKISSTKYLDTDARLIREALGLPEPPERINPIVVSRNILDMKGSVEVLKKAIIDNFNSICEGKDVVLIEGYHLPEAMSSIGLATPEIARILNAKPVLLVTARGEETIDEVADRVLLYKLFFEHWGSRLEGVILNGVPIYYYERVEDFVVPHLKELGLKVYGIIKERPKLLAPSVRDVVVALNAEVLENADKLDNVIEDIVIGAMTPMAALRWFRRAVNAAVITGGDRTDLIIAALETRPSTVILTGNLYPDIGVLIKAREVGVPLLLVPYDTYTTAVKLRELQMITTLDSLKSKEGEIVNMVDKEVEWRRLLEE